ncbi:hypothetical protein GCM10022215_21670 [Nocardioides fonticola]|uniref:Uncharacterized protein n=1 Tax=Nocardioides fonticola TaxID=450363 RepID=A0ABP7XK66_9ACTN
MTTLRDFKAWHDARAYDDVWIEGLSTGGRREQGFVVRPAGARWNLSFFERGQEELLEGDLDETALVALLRREVERIHRPRP